MKKRKIKFRHIWWMLLAALLLYVFANVGGIWVYAGRDETRAADVAIILGAAAWEGEPSPVFRERINHGIALYQQGYVQKLLMTGGVPEGAAQSEAAIARDYALEQGIPAADILMEEQSSITQENLQYAAAVMAAEGLETALIVSDPLHMKRAMLLAKDQGIRAYSSPTPSSRYIHLRTKLPFLARETFFYIGYKLWRIFFPVRPA